MKNLEEIRKILVEHKEEIRKKDGVVITGIFGSYSKGRQEESSDIDILSDIDVLVEIEKLIGFKLFGLQDELEEPLDVKVDLLTINAVKQKKN